MARFEKDVLRYILKNKDIPIVSFEYEKYKEQGGEFEGYTKYRFKNIKILNENLLPKNMNKNLDSVELKKWIERRRIPKNRKNMLDILSYELEELHLNPNNLMNYIDVSYGLSLNDSYWIVPNDEKEYFWKDYNLYENKFSDILSLIAFGEKGEIGTSNGIKTSPEYTTEGMIAKCWAVIDGKICLLKKSTESHQKEAYTEYYMSQIAEIMGFEHVKYDILEYHGHIVSCCPLFTNENIGLVAIEDCLDKNDKYKSDISLLKAISKVYPKEALEDLMLFDSLVYNTDRHIRNFGLLLDNNTGEILRPAPIFDNGNSITTLIDENTDIEKICNRYTSKIEIDFDFLSKYSVQDRHRESLEKLKSFRFLRHPKYNLDNKILEKAEKFIIKRAELSLRQLNIKNMEKLGELSKNNKSLKNTRGRGGNER